MRSDLTRWAVRGIGLALGVSIVVGMVGLAVAAQNVVLLVFAGVLLSSALAPMIGTIRRRTGLGRRSAILIVYATFAAIVLFLALIVVPGAIRQGEDLLASLPPFFEEIRTWTSELRPPTLARSATALVDSFAGILEPPPPPDPDVVVAVGATFAEGAITLATLLTIVVFLLLEHARIQRYVLAFVPADHRGGVRAAWNEIEVRLGMWVRGQLILMGVIGVTTGIAYSLLGLPGALLLALLAALFEAVPIVGPLLGAIPALLVAATMSLQLVLVVAGVYLVLQLVEGNILVPIVMRNTVGISPFLVLVSLLVGGTVGGVIGALFAVPIAASAEIALARLQARAVPIAQDPGGVEDADADADAAEQPGRVLPDRSNAGVD